MKNESKAFKKIWEVGMSHTWAVIWCPAEELPKNYLQDALTKPNRTTGGDGLMHE